jgi:hypothetical protein
VFTGLQALIVQAPASSSSASLPCRGREADDELQWN